MPQWDALFTAEAEACKCGCLVPFFVGNSVKHECEMPGSDQRIEIRQVEPTDPWFMLVGDSVIVVNYCPWCGKCLPVITDAGDWRT